MSKRSQCDLLLNWMRQGHSITSIEALAKFNCLRLAARILDLKERGHDIVTLPHQTPSGKKVAKYWLLRSA